MRLGLIKGYNGKFRIIYWVKREIVLLVSFLIFYYEIVFKENKFRRGKIYFDFQVQNFQFVVGCFQKDLVEKFGRKILINLQQF